MLSPRGREAGGQLLSPSSVSSAPPPAPREVESQGALLNRPMYIPHSPSSSHKGGGGMLSMPSHACFWRAVYTSFSFYFLPRPPSMFPLSSCCVRQVLLPRLGGRMGRWQPMLETFFFIYLLINTYRSCVLLVVGRERSSLLDAAGVYREAA